MNGKDSGSPINLPHTSHKNPTNKNLRVAQNGYNFVYMCPWIFLQNELVASSSNFFKCPLIDNRNYLKSMSSPQVIYSKFYKHVLYFQYYRPFQIRIINIWILVIPHLNRPNEENRCLNFLIKSLSLTITLAIPRIRFRFTSLITTSLSFSFPSKLTSLSFPTLEIAF